MRTDVEGRQIEGLGVAEGVVIARLAAHRQPPPPGQYPALGEGQVRGLIVVKGVAAALRLEGQREGRIGVDVDGFDGVHLNGHREAHGGYFGQSAIVSN